MSETAADWIFNVTEADFEQKVVQESARRPVVVDFWAPWCAPCRHLGPMLEKLIAERAGQIVMAKVNVDENQSLASRYHVRGIPTLMLFKGGEVVATKIGAVSKAQLAAFIDANL